MEIISTTVAPRRTLSPRLLVQMPVYASWTDGNTGEIVSVSGTTETIGTTSVLVNFDNLPPVGGNVHLKMMNEEDTLLEVQTRVIRVERDPSKPLAALNVLDRVDEWKERVWTTAQEVLAKTYEHDEDEWIN